MTFFSTSVMWTAFYEEIALLLLTIVLLYLNALYLRRRQRWREPLEARARELVVALSSSDQGELDGGDITALAALPSSITQGALVALAPSLQGGQRERLRRIAERVGLLERARGQCASRRWQARVRGVRLFTSVGGGEDVVPALINDPHPMVRGEAADWAAEHADERIIFALLQALQRNPGLSGFAQKDALLRIGAAVVEPLQAELQRAAPGTDVAALMEIAAGLADVRLCDLALQHVLYPDPQVRRMAARLIGSIGGAGAVKALEKMLDDDDAGVRATAAASLGHLRHWPAGVRLASMLTDRSFDVRRNAAQALRELGAPGLLLLRDSLSSSDRYAADMARQTLDLEAAEGVVS